MLERSPIRVLHVLGSLNRGGVETWLMEVFRHIDRSRFEMDVLVQSAVPGTFDAEAGRLGVSVIPSAGPTEPLRFARRLAATLRTGPGYDVVHSHVHHFSAYPLGLAGLAGVPVRVAHSHSDTASVQRSAGRRRRMYTSSARRVLGIVATDRLAASVPAGRALFGADWPDRPGDRVLHYGFDFRRSDREVDAGALRRELGIPPGSFVVGHVGRFDPVKNHGFVIDVLTALVREKQDAHLLLVGDGATRQETEKLVAARGLGDRVVFAGERSDVPAVMRAAVDVLLLPSLYEGLGIVALEAQAAGVPSVLSSTVPAEVSVVPELTRYLSLDEPASVWAHAVVDAAAHDGHRRSRTDELMASSFGIDACLDALAEVYTREASGSARVRST